MKQASNTINAKESEPSSSVDLEMLGSILHWIGHDQIAMGDIGRTLVLQGEFSAARAVLDNAEMPPFSHVWTISVGHTYLLQGDQETAHTWYQMALPMILNKEVLKSGPLADFDHFIEHGWQVDACREERAWMAQAYAKLFPKDLR